MTCHLLDLSDWLAGQGVTILAMESTGSYGKPVFNILESTFRVVLVNAHHIKQVPGRKTDVKDSEWIAQLLQHGLLRPSFVPPRPTRELRDLTRQRTQLIREKTTVANRIQKVLEDARSQWQPRERRQAAQWPDDAGPPVAEGGAGAGGLGGLPGQGDPPVTEIPADRGESRPEACGGGGGPYDPRDHRPPAEGADHLPGDRGR